MADFAPMKPSTGGINGVFIFVENNTLCLWIQDYPGTLMIYPEMTIQVATNQTQSPDSPETCIAPAMLVS